MNFMRLPQSAHDALSAHIAVLDAQGTILEVNAAWHRFARENGAVDDRHGVGENYLAVCDSACGESAEGASVMVTGIRAVLSGECDLFHLEYPCDSPDAKRWFGMRAARFAADGAVRVVVAHENITEQKQAKEVLEASERRLQMALQAGGLGVFEHTPHDDRVIVSREFCQIVGFPLQTSISHDEWIEQMHADDRGRVLAGVQRMLAEQVALDLEYRLYLPEGKVRWVRATASPVAEKGKVARVYGVVQDITERTRTVRQLAEHRESDERSRRALEHEQELNRIKSGFISLVSHEFRSPLCVIKTAAALLDDYLDRMTGTERAENIEDIQRAVVRMTQMMEDLLVHEKLGGGKMEISPARVDLESMCRRLVREASDQPGAITYAVEPTAREALIDERILIHILDNLLRNAVKYSPRDCIVTLEVKRVAGHRPADGGLRSLPQDRLQLKVIDSGIGIPAADLANLFKAFHRASNVGNRPGTGMGLAIVKQCVDALEGTITVESQVGVGTTVSVSLPIAFSSPSAVLVPPVSEGAS